MVRLDQLSTRLGSVRLSILSAPASRSRLHRTLVKSCHLNPPVSRKHFGPDCSTSHTLSLVYQLSRLSRPVTAYGCSNSEGPCWQPCSEIACRGSAAERSRTRRGHACFTSIRAKDLWSKAYIAASGRSPPGSTVPVQPGTDMLMLSARRVLPRQSLRLVRDF